MHIPDEVATQRQKKVSLEIKRVAQDFFQRESSSLSLITVTDCDVSKDLKRTTVYITCLPEDKTNSAIDFAKRMRGELRNELKKKLTMRYLPHVEVTLDIGELNRQKIEKELRKLKK